MSRMKKKKHLPRRGQWSGPPGIQFDVDGVAHQFVKNSKRGKKRS